MRRRATPGHRSAAVALTALLLLPGLTGCSAGIEPAEAAGSAPTSDGKVPADDPTPGPHARPADTSGPPTDDSAPYISSTCQDDDLDVTQDDATVLMDGQCATVTIMASGAYLSLDDARSVVVIGDGNTILAGAVGQVTVSGSDNYLSLDTVKGAVTDEGAGNTVLTS
ncbi:DUF3060 domain-containing protein [Cellulomonas sp. KRMCY2]|uniref:DUF3060 domain-containing protein n=1 Tax=Cellulomonas sp. KRMCY2 TaxID=1304865 RepID=UPI0004B127DB|nr:DUF3060 domain-containing protein [Cellulomonas sp. KRMCY2]